MEEYIIKDLIRENIACLLSNNICETETLTNKLLQLEFNSIKLAMNSTYKSDLYRDNRYKTTQERNVLRMKILRELITEEICKNENEIVMGIGGCKPPHIQKRQFFQVIGIPGAGKSYISNIISENYGAYLIDSDFAKRKFPEYQQHICAASLLHEESSEIAYKISEDSVFTYCMQNYNSMVIPRIGNVLNKLSDYLYMIHSYGYQVFLILVDISTSDAIRSCYSRFVENGRYISLMKICSEYGSLPRNNYEIVKNYNFITGYAMLQTGLDRKYRIIEKSGLNDFIL